MTRCSLDQQVVESTRFRVHFELETHDEHHWSRAETISRLGNARLEAQELSDCPRLTDAGQRPCYFDTEPQLRDSEVLKRLSALSHIGDTKRARPLPDLFGEVKAMLHVRSKHTQTTKQGNARRRITAATQVGM